MALLTPEERRDYRRRIDATEDPATRDLVRAERRELRSQRREQRREEGKAPDQVIGRVVADVLDEDAARAMVRELLPDIADALTEGQDFGAMLEDIVIPELRDAADELLDFSSVPGIGWALELVDGYVFDAIASGLKPWLGKLIAEELTAADEQGQ